MTQPFKKNWIQNSEMHYSVKEYMSWDDDKRYELIAGSLYGLAPAPRTKHQKISVSISSRIFMQLIGKDCKIFEAPTDVVLSEDTVVQPDIMIICDKSKIAEKFIDGAPEVIFEILSPSTSFKDKQIKLHLYEKYGVKEYFIVSPDQEIVELYRLKKDKFQFPIVYNWDQKIKINTIDVELKLWEIFEKNFPEEKNAKTEKL
ncbi:MAG: Uma2 family endonuclease [Candidatus Cloacimonadota bacterium]|nr:Uma2 family endonuclease [Candidatus Cloacimonadota bacterium]